MGGRRGALNAIQRPGDMSGAKLTAGNNSYHMSDPCRNVVSYGHTGGRVVPAVGAAGGQQKAVLIMERCDMAKGIRQNMRQRGFARVALEHIIETQSV
jgi:hypothetical protein